MGVTLAYAPGATPLDPEEAAALIPKHITTQAQLNEWEHLNIVQAQRWAFGKKRKKLLSPDFMYNLHERMFKDTWRWAGQLRRTEKNIGIAPENIAVEIKNLCENMKVQLETRRMGIDEIAARFHHRLVYIHPFPNGNGRFSRMMTDLLLEENDAEHFTWGQGDLINEGEIRRRYISALRSADAKDFSPLFKFVRGSGD